MRENTRVRKGAGRPVSRCGGAGKCCGALARSAEAGRGAAFCRRKIFQRESGESTVVTTHGLRFGMG